MYVQKYSARHFRAGYVNLLRLTHNDFAVKANKDPKNLMKYHVIDPASLTM